MSLCIGPQPCSCDNRYKTCAPTIIDADAETIEYSRVAATPARNNIHHRTCKTTKQFVVQSSINTATCSVTMVLNAATAQIKQP